MSESLSSIHARLRAADLALARAQGGSSELAEVRAATGALLLAVHELVSLWEKQQLAIGGLEAERPIRPPARTRRAAR